MTATLGPVNLGTTGDLTVSDGRTHEAVPKRRLGLFLLHSKQTGTMKVETSKGEETSPGYVAWMLHHVFGTEPDGTEAVATFDPSRPKHVTMTRLQDIAG